MELVLSLIAALCTITLFTAVVAVVIAVRKAPPETNEALAYKVSQMQIELADVYDALDKWNKRIAVRESRAKASTAPEQAQDALTGGAKTGILRQPMLPGQRMLGGAKPGG